MSVKDVSQVGHLSLIDGAKKAARPDRELEVEDKVTVSEATDIAATVSSAQLAASADRSQVVQALAVAVRQGNYKPDPQRIAQQILEDAELIARLQALLKR